MLELGSIPVAMHASHARVCAYALPCCVDIAQGRGLYPYQGSTWSPWLLSLSRSAPEGYTDTLRCENQHADKCFQSDSMKLVYVSY